MYENLFKVCLLLDKLLCRHCRQRSLNVVIDKNGVI